MTIQYVAVPAWADRKARPVRVSVPTTPAIPTWFAGMRARGEAVDFAHPTAAGTSLVRRLRARNQVFGTLPADQRAQVNADRFVTVEELDALLAKVELGLLVIGEES